MAPSFQLLLLPFLLFVAGSTQESGNSNSSTPAPISGINHTSVTPHPTQKDRSTREGIEFIIGGSEEEYDYEDDGATVASTSSVTKLSCQYDRCEHLAPTCEEIQWQQGGHCLCPGVDGPEFIPDFPSVRDLLLGETQMTINWCSPSSTVRGYRVLYGKPGGSPEKGPNLNTSFRSYTIDNLDPASQYTVCVVAFNEAGESPVEEEEDRPAGSKPGPCMTVHTSMTSLYIGVGIGLAALAGLLIILGFCLWSRKRNKAKREAKLEDGGASNYTYRAGSIGSDEES
ncbi:LRRN4 C-terminal-like protein [Anomaloglossus baeobatrachus]|uniref:LRRN4 C-terminal-like protein n=1 Tax=Anomaloglossus baeobatrachus TaxID=238106 RepID=UPI003F4F492A